MLNRRIDAALTADVDGQRLVGAVGGTGVRPGLGVVGPSSLTGQWWTPARSQ
jgi:hypothetical protein